MSLTALWSVLVRTPAILKYATSLISLWFKAKPLFERIGRLIVEAATFANLTAEQRRGYVTDQARHWLDHYGIRLTDQQLALVIEILYGYLKQTKGHRFAPKPLIWGRVPPGRDPIAMEEFRETAGN